MPHCDSTCYHCATTWWEWLKAREAQMATPRKTRKIIDAETGKMVRVPLVEKISWSEAAASSVRAPRPAVGARVRVRSLLYEHEAVVTMNTGVEGLDGRHWVGVDVTTPGSAVVWHVHVEAGDLVEVPPTSSAR